MPATSSLNQGQNFQRLTASYHGGKRKNMSKYKMQTKKRSSKNRMRGGGSFFTPYSDYPTALDQSLPSDIRVLARVAPLDAKFAELPSVVPMSGGRRSNKGRKYRGGKAPLDQPSMLLSSAEEEAAARLNPQWYTENTVIPNFRGPLPLPGGTTPAPAPPAAVAPGPAKGGRRTKVRRNRRKLTMRR